MKTIASAFALAAALALATAATAQEHDHAGHGEHAQHDAGHGEHAHDAAHFATARHAEHRLRDAIVAFQAGTPDYDGMTADLADAVRGAPEAMTYLQGAGAIQALEHTGEPQPGVHTFRVTFANGDQTAWTIAVNGEDKIQGLLLQRPA